VDKERAQRFLAELSTVYRYLLRSNRQPLATVAEELRFIDSYFQLLQTRYGASVQLNVAVEPAFYQHQLPPLSLQLLVENVVKHNALSKAKPLMIDFFTTPQNQLVVSNNCQPKAVKAPSHQVGLQNIRKKYELLGLEGFAVLNMPPQFTVVLPLLAPSAKTLLQPLAKPETI
jgi:LytS/YehU family sensor histidine kinase